MSFDDLTNETQEVRDAVAWLKAEGITEGTSETTFSPDLAVTRAQMALFLYRNAGSPPVPQDPQPEPEPVIAHPYVTMIDGTAHVAIEALADGVLCRVDLDGDGGFTPGVERDGVKPGQPQPITAPAGSLIQWDLTQENPWTRLASGSLIALESSNPVPEPEPDPDDDDLELETLWVGNRVDDWYSTAHSGGGRSDDAVVEGEPAVKLALPASGQGSSGARLNHQGFGGSRELPTHAIYSCEYLVPEKWDFQDLTFQFKQGNGSTRQHIWNVGWRPVGDELRFIIRTRLQEGTSIWQQGPYELALLDAAVPIGEWFTLEVERKISEGDDGVLIASLNGVDIYEQYGPNRASNLDPRPAGDNEWVVCHYFGSWQSGYPASEVFVRNARIQV